MKNCLLLLFFCLLVLTACARGPRSIVAEPLDSHDRDKDHASCRQYAQRYGVINMDPLMSGSGMEEFPDEQRQVQLYEFCMLKKGYRF
ncbi:MAG: hypothetical protein GXP51_03250 [Deltaproteobacteria bacterium]|nr:hypothetical protein [Deltaproteobacteria bacterium]